MDLVSLKTYLECDNAFLLELLEQFEIESERCHKEFVEFMRTSDLKSMQRTAHRLLSSSSILGFSSLSDILKAIERTDEWNDQKINELVDKYEKEMHNCGSSIDTARKELAKSG